MTPSVGSSNTSSSLLMGGGGGGGSEDNAQCEHFRLVTAMVGGNSSKCPGVRPLLRPFRLDGHFFNLRKAKSTFF